MVVNRPSGYDRGRLIVHSGYDRERLVVHSGYDRELLVVHCNMVVNHASGYDRRSRKDPGRGRGRNVRLSAVGEVSHKPAGMVRPKPPCLCVQVQNCANELLLCGLQAEIVPGQCGNSVVMDTQYVGLTDAVQREVLVKVGGQRGDGCVKWSVDQHPPRLSCRPASPSALYCCLLC